MKVEVFAPQLAAGALVWRITDGVLEILAVHRPRYDDWSWPKGKLDPGETLPTCAVREVAEETGAIIALGVPLPTLRYSLEGGRTKVVSYWAAQEIDPESPPVSARAKVKKAPKHEIDEKVWLTVDEARERITFANDLIPLEDLARRWQQGTLETRPLVVVRHARARSRSGWSGNDQRRPLTGGGTRRAEELRGFLAAFGVVRLASSPSLRCVQTVTPFAAAAGLTVRGLEAITEESFRDKPTRTATAFSEVLAKRKPRALCVHRPTLPTLMEVLTEALSPQVRGKLPTAMPYLPAGGVLVAHVLDTDAGPEIVAVETHGVAVRA